MDAKTFNTVLESQLERSTSVLLSKADEYASDGDRLHNFKAAAHLGQTNLREALSGMMIKHTVSVYDMLNSGKQYSEEQWNEKITDHINYLLLARAVIEEDDAILPKEKGATSVSDEDMFNLREKLTGGSNIEAAKPVTTAGPTIIPNSPKP